MSGIFGKALIKVRKLTGLARSKSQPDVFEVQDSFECSYDEILMSLCTSADHDHEAHGEAANVVLQSACDFLDFLETRIRKQSTTKPRMEKSSNMLARVCQNTSIHLSSIVHALVYLQRVQEAGVVLSTSKINAYLLVALMAAAKFLEDGCPSNAHWARVGLLSIEDTNEYERKFLAALRFRLFVPAEEFSAMAGELLSFRTLEDPGSSLLALRFRASFGSSQPSSPIPGFSRSPSSTSSPQSPLPRTPSSPISPLAAMAAASSWSAPARRSSAPNLSIPRSSWAPVGPAEVFSPRVQSSH